MTIYRPTAEYLGVQSDVTLLEVLDTAQTMSRRCAAFDEGVVLAVNIPFGWEDLDEAVTVHTNLYAQHCEGVIANLEQEQRYGRRVLREFTLSMNAYGEMDDVPDEALRTIDSFQDITVNVDDVSAVTWEYQLNIMLSGESVTWDESRAYQLSDFKNNTLGHIAVALDTGGEPDSIGEADHDVLNTPTPIWELEKLFNGVGQQIKAEARQRRLNQAMGLLVVIDEFAVIPDIGFSLPPELTNG